MFSGLGGVLVVTWNVHMESGLDSERENDGSHKKKTVLCKKHAALGVSWCQLNCIWFMLFVGCDYSTGLNYSVSTIRSVGIGF